MNSHRAHSPHRFWAFGSLLAIGWGVAAFGSPYPWAYGPLLIACSVLGIWASFAAPQRFPISLALALGFLVIAVAVQLLPLPLTIVDRVSPNASAIHRQHDLLAATSVADSQTLSIAPRQTRLGLTFLVTLGLFLLGSTSILNGALTKFMAWGVVWIGVAIGFAGIAQRATFNGKIYGFWQPLQPGAPFGPFVNRNHFAGWMLMTVPLGLGLMLALVDRASRRHSGGRRLSWLLSSDANSIVLLIFSICVMSLALLLTLSRSGIASMSLAIVLATAWAGLKYKTALRLVLGACAVAFVLLGIVWIGIDQLVARFTDIHLGDINERPAIWADAVRIFQHFWLTGTGLNTYGVSTLFYQTSSPGLHVREAHNDYLQLAAEGGLLLVVPTLVLIAVFLALVRAAIRTSEGSVGWIRLGAVTGVFAIAVQSAVEFSLQMPGNAVLFCMLCAIAMHRDSASGVVHR